MRVVLDTNVLVSGIFFHGAPGKILDAWVNDRFTLFASPFILDEYGRVIFELTFDKDEFLAMEWLNTLFGLCHVFPDPAKRAPYCRDPKDDKFVQCAIGAKADYLVSGDKDILSLAQSFPFQIVSPRGFLSRI